MTLEPPVARHRVPCHRWRVTATTGTRAQAARRAADQTPRQSVHSAANQTLRPRRPRRGGPRREGHASACAASVLCRPRRPRRPRRLLARVLARVSAVKTLESLNSLREFVGGGNDHINRRRARVQAVRNPGREKSGT